MESARAEDGDGGAAGERGRVRAVCPFCGVELSAQYLVRHVQRDHEGAPECRGPEMVAYLASHRRRLCGSCYRTSPHNRRQCLHCQASWESEVPGSLPPGASRILRELNPPPVPETAAAPALDAANLANLPSPAAVCTLRLPVLPSVPKQCRSEWAQALASCLARAKRDNTLVAWLQLLMLPKCVLWVPNTR